MTAFIGKLYITMNANLFSAAFNSDNNGGQNNFFIRALISVVITNLLKNSKINKIINVNR